MKGAHFIPEGFAEVLAGHHRRMMRQIEEILDLFDPGWRDRPVPSAAEQWADLDEIKDEEDPSWDDLAAKIGIPLRFAEPGEPVMNVDLGIQLYWPGEPPSTP
jgi:hypothetical protein